MAMGATVYKSVVSAVSVPVTVHTSVASAVSVSGGGENKFNITPVIPKLAARIELAMTMAPAAYTSVIRPSRGGCCGGGVDRIEKSPKLFCVFCLLFNLKGVISQGYKYICFYN
ncbi:hypothetical protein MIMGU_mgv1a016634mg [Erythranthe guttata]|uniref:Uncharacterized protein n=1 Tax=Erythranthe guttata TaxID=4155 RepID=A0A022QE67_ERYGU|nr:hypothetical protein MIMGU_mgv1a016634mg [Erythranthe guttata]